MSCKLLRMAFAVLVVAGVSTASARGPDAFAQLPPAVPNPPPAALPVPARVAILGVPAVAATNQLLSLEASVTFMPGAVLAGNVSWTFGDGDTAEGLTVTHAYRSAGSYDVRVSLFVSSAISATVSTNAELTVEDSAVLQPGDSIGFASPFALPPQPAPPARPMPIRGGFGPLNVTVENQSDQPLTAGYDYDSSKEPAAIREAQVGLALPEGYALQVLAPPAGGGTPFSPFQGCLPVGDRANQAECPVPTSGMGTPSLHLAVNAAAEGAVHSLTLPAGTSVALLGPETSIGSTGDVPALLVGSRSDQTTAITWDGSTLVIAEPGGYAISVNGARNLPPNASTVPIDCSPLEGQTSAMECSLDAVPPVQVSFSTVLRAPVGTMTLPYADTYGRGTMTIVNDGPDVAPGGAAIDVSLVQPDTTLSGSGVMRPGFQAGDFLLAFELANASGDRYLFQAQVTADTNGFSGKGLWLSEADESYAGAWSLGTPSGRIQPYTPGGISLLASSPHGGPLNPGLPLPSFTGSELTGLISPPSPPPGSPPPAPFGVVPPPSIGQTGQPLTPYRRHNGALLRARGIPDLAVELRRRHDARTEQPADGHAHLGSSRGLHGRGGVHGRVRRQHVCADADPDRACFVVIVSGCALKPAAWHH